MTAVAYALALVVVALVARDVALRALADRARERGRERADAKRLAELEETIEGWKASDQALVVELCALTKEHRDLAAKVEKLLARDNLKGMGGR